MSRPRNLTEIKRHPWAGPGYWPYAPLNPGGTVIMWHGKRVTVLRPHKPPKALLANDLPDVVRQIIKEVVVWRLARA